MIFPTHDALWGRDSVIGGGRPVYPDYSVRRAGRRDLRDNPVRPRKGPTDSGQKYLGLCSTHGPGWPPVLSVKHRPGPPGQAPAWTVPLVLCLCQQTSALMASLELQHLCHLRSWLTLEVWRSGLCLYPLFTAALRGNTTVVLILRRRNQGQRREWLSWGHCRSQPADRPREPSLSRPRQPEVTPRALLQQKPGPSNPGPEQAPRTSGELPVALQDPCYVAQEPRWLSIPHVPFQPPIPCPHEVPPPQGPGSASEKPQGKSRVSLNEMTSSSLGRGQGGEDGGPSFPREEPGGLGQTLQDSVTTSKRAVSVSVNTSKRTVQKDGERSRESAGHQIPPGWAVEEGEGEAPNAQGWWPSAG